MNTFRLLFVKQCLNFRKPVFFSWNKKPFKCNFMRQNWLKYPISVGICFGFHKSDVQFCISHKVDRKLMPLIANGIRWKLETIKSWATCLFFNLVESIWFEAAYLKHPTLNSAHINSSLDSNKSCVLIKTSHFVYLTYLTAAIGATAPTNKKKLNEKIVESNIGANIEKVWLVVLLGKWKIDSIKLHTKWAHCDTGIKSQSHEIVTGFMPSLNRR